MKKPIRILLVAFPVAFLAWCAWRMLRPTQPLYQGKPVDAWLDDLAASRDNGYREALSRIGPPAIPFIIAKLNQSDSPLVNMYRDLWPRLPPLLKQHFPTPVTGPPSFSSFTAASAFSCIGTNATPALFRASRHVNPAVRQAAVSALSGFVGRSLTANDAIHLFTKSLADRDSGVRLSAATGIDRIGPAASRATPALVKALQGSEAGRLRGSRYYARAAAARALASIGPAAAGAMPALNNLLSSAGSDSYLRVNAAYAVWRISSNDNLVLPVIMADMPALRNPAKWMPIETIKEIGPRAKAAFPLLLNELTNSDEYTRKLTIETMLVIDPEAAAKAGVK